MKTEVYALPELDCPNCAMKVERQVGKIKGLSEVTEMCIRDRVGSLEVGKDADIVITDGDPLAMFTTVRTVLINGEIVA